LLAAKTSHLSLDNKYRIWESRLIETGEEQTFEELETKLNSIDVEKLDTALELIDAAQILDETRDTIQKRISDLETLQAEFEEDIVSFSKRFSFSMVVCRKGL